MTCEAAGANPDGGERLRLLQIDIGSLFDIEIAIPHGFEGFADVLQVCSAFHPIWIPLCARTFVTDASVVVRVFSAAFEYYGMVGRQHRRGVGIAGVVCSKGDVLEPRGGQVISFWAVIQQIGVRAVG